MAKQKSTSEILKKRSIRDKESFITNILLWFVSLIVLIILSSAITIGGIYFYLSRDLPKISSLTDYRPPIITTVYSDDNRKIAEFYNERRIVIPLSEMPKMLIDAF
ncbi:MAG: penicillin-binding protein, partial [Desulfobacterales bacterium]|nr:penicillin-binding protein [Desulfobacterales bacterium]MCD4804593.1 penicillin-binding protein [Desulfobacterales bacterium]